MRSDDEIKRDVEQALRRSPHLDAGDIGVVVNDGVVMLGGFVAAQAEKLRAEEAAKATAGVAAVANVIQVRTPDSGERADPYLVRDAAAALKALLPQADLAVIARDGWVRLEGEVSWPAQRQLAGDAVRRLSGVKGVTNLVRVRGREPLTAEEALAALAMMVLAFSILAMVSLTVGLF